MKGLIDIREYRDSEYVVKLRKLKRACPLYNVSEGIWIVGNEHLSYGADVEFTLTAARGIAKRIASFQASTLITAGFKSVALAYEIAKLVGFADFYIARKNANPHLGEFASANINSITSGKAQRLYLDSISAKRIKGKSVVLFDDVISMGSTMQGLLDLAQNANAKIAAIASIWIEGPWVFKRFHAFHKAGKLVFLGVLPIFAEETQYRKLCCTRDRLVRKFNLA
jgi:adenine/guanine phosphoribosyltransferase-like PRPP-binding protein